MYGAFFQVFLAFAKLIGWLGLVILIAISPILVMCLFFIIYYLIKGKRFPKSKRGYYKEPNFFVRLFWLFPQRLVLDFFNRDVDAFPHHGLHLFAGEQGSGKTIAIVHFLLKLKKQYPKMKLRSNISLTFQDDNLESWQQLVMCSNGIYGQVELIDEIQNWFNSNESKNFPVDMIQEICQQRKQRKMIVGSSQVFTRVAKPLREQVSYLYEPITIFGCLTIVRVSRPRCDDNAQVKSKRHVKTYFFIHNDEIRNAYDTFEKVERMTIKGFQPRSEHINNSTSYFGGTDV